MHHRHELPFGAELAEAGARFRVWSPRAESVALQLEGATPTRIEMRREPEGVFAAETDQARSGTRYRYVVDGNTVPDPASRFQPDDVHGPSEIVDPTAYAWRDLGWRGIKWHEIVLYELHVGTFSTEGNFAGVVAHLDHIRALGATAVELMPVADFPGARNWGYDGVLLYAPDSRYGRPEDLKALVEACHERGLAIFLDVVYNHFGPEGNYLPAVAPDYFTERHKTPWGAAVDYDGQRSRSVRDFVVHNALFWIEEYQFDGLRLDAVHAIIDDSEPHILTEIAETVRRRVTDREVHLVLENDRNEARRLSRLDGRPLCYDAQWNDDLHHALHVLVTGDVGGYYADYADRPAAHLGRTLAEGFAYQGDPSPLRDGERRGEPSAHLPPTAFVSFLQNHDQVGNNAFGTRISARASEARLHAGVAIVLLSPEIPLLFMGEEWATDRPFAFFCDFEDELAQAVRDGRRREFAQFPEFQDEEARDRIPDPTAPETFVNSCLDWQELHNGVHARWHRRYRDLLAIRKREIVPHLGELSSDSGSYEVLAPQAVTVSWRIGGGGQLHLFANFAAEPVAVETPPNARLIYASGEPAETMAAAETATFFLSESDAV